MSFETKNPREQALDSLKTQLSENALNISQLYLHGYPDKENRGWEFLKDTLRPGTYNENGGVIVFATNEGRYAVPSNSHVKDLLLLAEFQKDESVAVPSLNDGNMWGTEAERRTNSGFQEWQKLYREI